MRDDFDISPHYQNTIFVVKKPQIYGYIAISTKISLPIKPIFVPMSTSFSIHRFRSAGRNVVTSGLADRNKLNFVCQLLGIIQ